MWKLKKKNNTNKLFNKQKQTQKTNLWLPKDKEWNG